MRWVNRIRRYGYDFEHRLLNAADFGAYTSRKRFFGIFAKKGLPIVFPEQKHCRSGENGLFGETMPKWRPVREVLDFEDEGKSIFAREKPLSEKTLERIYAGLIKFVAGGKDAFLVKYNSMGANGRYAPPSIDDPCPTVATQGRLAIASVAFLSKQYGGSAEGKNISVDGPAGTITTIDHHAFVSVHYGNGYNRGIEDPAPTLTCKDRLAIVKPCFLDNQYGNGRATSVETVSGCLTTNPKQQLVTCDRFLMNPQFGSAGSSVEDPCFTLIARMDKRPPYLIVTESGDVAIEIYDDDSEMTVRIKQFMALYNIIDIKMRMLKISEMKLIQGFPKDYVLIGTQADQKKFLGNAVEVTLARKLCEALCAGLRDKGLTKSHPTKRAA